MKIKILLYFFIGIIWSSCAPRYQIHELDSIQVQEVEEDVYLYESEDIAITYDFWAEGGYLLFEVYNQQDSVLYLDLKQSNFTVNGEMFSYFEENQTTGRKIEQQKILKIDAQGNQTIEGFPVTYEWHGIPKKREALFFDKGDSPLMVENKLVYAFNQSFKNKQTLKNEFWVKKIKQVKKRDFKDYQDTQKSKSDKFYVNKHSVPNSDNSVYWLEVVLTVLEVLLFF